MESVDLNATLELSMEEDERNSQEGGQSSEDSEVKEVIVETVKEISDDEEEWNREECDVPSLSDASESEVSSIDSEADSIWDADTESVNSRMEEEIAMEAEVRGGEGENWRHKGKKMRVVLGKQWNSEDTGQ